MKVGVILTYRGAYARLKTFLCAVRNEPNLELKLIVGASVLLEKFGDASQVIEDDGFEIDARLHMVLEGENPIAMAKSTGIGIMELTNYLMVSNGADAQMFRNPSVSLTNAVQSLVILIAAGGLAGMIPARRAVSLRPVEALRAE